MALPRAPCEALRTHCLAAADQIAAECRRCGATSDDGARDDGDDDTGGSGLCGCGAPFVNLLGRQAVGILRSFGQDGGGDVPSSWPTSLPPPFDLIARRLDDLVELAHARFYAYAPRDVPACWRQLYTDASILQFTLRWLRAVQAGIEVPAQTGGNGASDSAPADDAARRLALLDSLVRPLDLALILAGGAGPAARGHAWIHGALDLLHEVFVQGSSDGDGDGDGDNDSDSDSDSDSEDGAGTSPAPRPKRRRIHDGLVHPAHHEDFAAGPLFNSPSVTTGVFVPPVCHPVARSGPLGLDAFQAYLDRWRRRRRSVAFDNAQADPSPDGPQPLVMTGLLDHWPAFRPDARPWASPAYLRWRTLNGRRLVPVELGRSYVDAGWTQAVVPFAEVLDALLGGGGGSGSDNTAGPMYLAQHSLFAQMPQLRRDIAVPDACYATAADARPSSSSPTSSSPSSSWDDAPEPLINAWLGPPGTITPLHTDPHHNLLAQVVGRKYLRLYAPAQTAALRPRGREAGVDMANTSCIDVGVVEGWDAPDIAADGNGHDNNHTAADDGGAPFRDIPYRDCLLEPGDTLYIPRGWWHYVRGLSVSFSVSFWWD